MSSEFKSSSNSEKSGGKESQTLRPETEAGKAGGVQPARDKAQKDWEESAKEDGE